MPDWGPINDSKSGSYALPYFVATQWISNSAGNQIEIEKGQIEYWKKGEVQANVKLSKAMEA